MLDTCTGFEVIDLCSSDDDEESDQEGDGQAKTTNEQVSSSSLHHRMESYQNTDNVSNARVVSVASSASSNNEDSTIVSRKRPAEIDLTGEEDQKEESYQQNSSIHQNNYAQMPQQQKFRGGGQGSSRDAAEHDDVHDETAASTAPSSSTPSPPTSMIRIVLEKDSRVKDTGILHEGMMDLLYQLNQTTIPIPAKLCTRHVSSVGVSNPYAKKQKKKTKHQHDDDMRSRLPSTVRYIQQQENWSCGYRSLQMILTALLPSLPTNHAYYQMVPRRRDHVAIPSLGQIQWTLEQAWRDGYDPQGARHYRQQIVGKTGKQGELGAIEISSVMTYWGLDTTVVQFVTCHQSRRLLPLFVKSYFAKALGKEDCPYCGGHGSIESNVAAAASLEAFVVGANATLDSSAMAHKILQFAEASLSIEETCDCPVLPLYLQWEGHAVTIVGYHEQNGCLLVFDPRKKVPKTTPLDQQQTTKPPPRHLWNTFQLDPEYLRNRDTQIIISSYKSNSPTEKESRREDMGVVTAAEDDVLRAIAASRS